MTSRIRLPAYVTDDTLPSFIELLGSGNDENNVILDFDQVKFLISGGIVALTTKVAAWKAAGVKVELINYEKSDAFRYLQRMNLFRACGYDIPEDFTRHDPKTRFMPVQRIGGPGPETDAIATDVARVVVPEAADLYNPDETGAFDYVEYSISELVNNVLHHSHGTGFISAQYHPERDLVRGSIADCGVGIRGSFAGSLHARQATSDLAAVRLALRAKVSSKSHLKTLWGESPNAGVGLTLIRELSARTGGSFLVLSGAGYYADGREGNFRDQFGFKGTIAAFTFRRSRVQNFPNLLYDAKVRLGLIEPMRGDHSEMFG